MAASPQKVHGAASLHLWVNHCCRASAWFQQRGTFTAPTSPSPTLNYEPTWNKCLNHDPQLHSTPPHKRCWRVNPTITILLNRLTTCFTAHRRSGSFPNRCSKSANEPHEHFSHIQYITIINVPRIKKHLKLVINPTFLMFNLLNDARIKKGEFLQLLFQRDGAGGAAAGEPIGGH